MSELLVSARRQVESSQAVRMAALSVLTAILALAFVVMVVTDQVRPAF